MWILKSQLWSSFSFMCMLNLFVIVLDNSPHSLVTASHVTINYNWTDLESSEIYERSKSIWMLTINMKSEITFQFEKAFFRSGIFFSMAKITSLSFC